MLPKRALRDKPAGVFQFAVAKRRRLACVTNLMRSLICFLALLGLVLPAAAQKPRATPAPSARPAATTPPARPQFRPAVLSSGPKSLVNLIDSKALLAQGQKDGAVQFSVTVGPDGEAADPSVYHAMPGSKALEEEVLKKLGASKFTPPFYEHQPVSVILYGTVAFDADNAPYVKILLNQDPKEIKAGSDFVGPQPVIGGDSRFHGLRIRQDVPVPLEAVVELKLHVDANGKMLDFAVTGEDPPLLGYGQIAEADFEGAKFIPAFRDGDVTESTSVISVCYKPSDADSRGDEQ